MSINAWMSLKSELESFVSKYLTAFAVGTRACLRQMSVPAKSNEIPAVPLLLLLQLLGLDGATVTLDAMHCQTATAQAIVHANADYTLSVKDNQSTLYQYLLEQFEAAGKLECKVEGMRRFTTVEKSHRRNERREYTVAGITDKDRTALSRWPELKTIGMVCRKRQQNDKEQMEVSFFISIASRRFAHLRSIFGGTGVSRTVSTMCSM